MSYLIKSTTLGKDEKILLNIKYSLFYIFNFEFLLYFFISLFFLIIYFTIYSNVDLLVFFIGFQIIAFKHLIINSWFIFGAESLLTNKRIIKSEGVFNKTINELNLNEIEYLKSNHSILGVYLNYGDVTLIGKGSFKFELFTIKNYMKVKQILSNIIKQQKPKLN